MSFYRHQARNVAKVVCAAGAIKVAFQPRSWAHGESIAKHAPGPSKKLSGGVLPPSYDLYPRLWHVADTKGDIDGVPLRVAQFNVLADGLSGDDEKLGGFTEVGSEALMWSFRGKRIVEELFRHGSPPDVIAMEEVDHFHDTLAPWLRSLGYEGFFVPKPRSRCKSPDGCALFCLRGAVEALEVESINYDSPAVEGEGKLQKSNQVALLAKLRIRGKATVQMAVSHLSAAKTADGESVRLFQAQQLRKAVVSRSDAPAIICMDMNAAPHRSKSADYDPEAYKFMSSTEFSSAYAIALGAEPNYTTWKRRGVKEAKHTIDYIFITPTVAVDAVLLPPPEALVQSERFPSFRYPSDHVALFADLRLPTS
mmetsp:Transcript_67778/g.126570  ORF Transcript_67778/g.126570 Transcript_67778/m.126570 type:complete len:367 (-) Transcript_67778:1-1101(-)